MGGHFDAPNLFDFECDIARRSKEGIDLRTVSPPGRIIGLSPRYRGKSIGSRDTDSTSQICTYCFDDDSHKGMAKWAEDESGAVTVTAFDYPG